METGGSNAPRTMALSEFVFSSPALARFIAIAVAGFVSVSLTMFFGQGLQSFEERLGAVGWTLEADRSMEERVTLVVIDEASLAEIGPWPWSRNDMATLVSAINSSGAQLQLHDIAYPERREGDDAFVSALTQSGASIIAQVPALDAQAGESSAGRMTHPIIGPICEGGPLALFNASSHVASAEVFENVPKGHSAALIDSDGAVRRTPALVCFDGEAFPALSISAFLQSSGAGRWRGEIRSGTTFFDPQGILTLDGYPGFEIPVDKNGAIRISFAKAPEAYRAIPAADIMKGRVDNEILDGSWVVVGGTAFGMADIVPTPYSGATFGVELQARLLTSMLDASVPYTPIGSKLILFFACLVFGLIVLALSRSGERIAAYGLPAAAICLPISAVGMHSIVLIHTNLWIGWVLPAIFGSLAASSLLLVELARVRLERSRVFTNLTSYLPSNVAREIAFALPSSRVNAQRGDATLMSADLRNFSAFGEARAPEEIAALLHFFFTSAATIIESQGGRVQEYRGDGILAIWDGADGTTAQNALQAARMMQESLSGKIMPEKSIEKLEPLALGIGLEQGPVLTGSIGPAHRRSHALLGDTVNIVLRIQEMTVEIAQPILLGECIARQLSGNRIESQGSYLLPGLKIPHTLFAPVDIQESESSRLESHKLSLIKGGRL